MNHYPHHIGDFDRATRHLNRIERSIYRDLLDEYYETEKPLTLDLPKLKRKILAISNAETPTGWYHSRCDAEILHYKANNSQKAMAGKASVVAKELRKQQALNGKSTDVEQTLNGAPTDVTTHVEQTFNGTSTNQNQNQNHKPITKEKKAQALVIPFDLPNWINKSHWDTWHSSPKRKAANHAQKQIAIGKLTRWRDEGLDHEKALEDAAAAGWQGLVDPKPKIKTSIASGYESPYSASQRKKFEAAAPMVAAQNPNLASVDPNAFLNATGAEHAIARIG
jgi:uncharacterized protein YdaU (DUF1376 family)